MARFVIISPRLRKYRMWIFQGYVIAAILAFSILALIANGTPYLRFDLHATLELQQELPAWITGVMLLISWPGYFIQSTAIVLFMLIFLLMFGLRWEAVSTIIGALSSSSVNYLIKIAIRRPRPSADLVDVFAILNSYSFPSGHVMFYTTYFGFLLFLAYILLKNSLLRTLIILVLLVLILSVGISRMYLGEHWASDVIGGYILGSLTLILSIQLYRWGKKRFSPNQPVASEKEIER